MLEQLDSVPWRKLEHAYGRASDVPRLLRRLLDADPKVRSNTMWELYGNVFHQGTRYPATPYVIPFLIELCAGRSVPERGELLRFWGHLIVGYFSVQERPCWGDGVHIHCWGEVTETDPKDPYMVALNRIYQESLKGLELLANLLRDEEVAVRAGAAWVLACLPTVAEQTVPALEARLRSESSGWVRAAIAFALGELGELDLLRGIASEDDFAAARCMAICQLARIEAAPNLIGPLVQFIVEPIDGYENIPGAGGKSTGDAAYAISHLPVELQCTAIPAICEQLRQARTFDTTPLVNTLLSAAFSPREEPLSELTDLQRRVLAYMVTTPELWSIGDIMGTLRAYGLPRTREECARMLGVEVTVDEAMKLLHSGLLFAEMGFLDKGREEILQALTLDPVVFERAAAPDQSWLLCAKAFAETDPERAVAAFQRASSINPNVVRRIDPTWRLADLLEEHGLS